MLRTPGIEPVVVIGQRDKQACSRTFVAFDQRFRFPVEQRPLSAQVLVTELGGVAIVRILEVVIGRSLLIHIACIPVPVFGHALWAPVRPDAELGVAIPFGRFVLQQRIPIRLVRPIPVQALHRRLHRHTIPRPAGQLGSLAPCGCRPVSRVQLFLHDLAIHQRIEGPLALRGGAELLIRLMELVETGSRDPQPIVHLQGWPWPRRQPRSACRTLFFALSVYPFLLRSIGRRNVGETTRSTAPRLFCLVEHASGVPRLPRSNIRNPTPGKLSCTGSRAST